MMIKPKGRPSTTCEYCKFLRKNKKVVAVESQCTCGRLEKKRLQREAEEEAKRKGLPLPEKEKKTRRKKDVSAVTGNNSNNSNNVQNNNGALRKKKLVEPRRTASSDHIHAGLQTNGKSLRKRNTTSSSGLSKVLKGENSHGNLSHTVNNNDVMTSPTSLNDYYTGGLGVGNFANDEILPPSNPFSGSFDRVESSASLDSSVFNKNDKFQGVNDSSSLLGREFLDTTETTHTSHSLHGYGSHGTSHSHPIIPGRVTKDYHHVPSMASISSLHSTQSLEQNINLPQSPPLSTMSFSLLSDTLSPTSASGTLHKNTAHPVNPKIVDWENGYNTVSSTDENSPVNANSGIVKNEFGDSNLHAVNLHSNKNLPRKLQRSVSDNLAQENATIGLNPLFNSKKITPQTRTRVGEVSIPLDEYVPPDINGIGKVNDQESFMQQDWPLPTDGLNDDSAIVNNLLDESQNSLGNSTMIGHNMNGNYGNNFSTQATDADNFSFMEGDMTSSSKNLNYSGLLDMLADSSSISTLSMANLMLQEGVKNPATIQSIRSGSNMKKSNEKYDDTAVASTSSQYVSHPAVRNNNDSDSVRSVEVLSLTPSFMDIPDRASNDTDTSSNQESGRQNSNRQLQMQYNQNQHIHPTSRQTAHKDYRGEQSYSQFKGGNGSASVKTGSDPVLASGSVNTPEAIEGKIKYFPDVITEPGNIQRSEGNGSPDPIFNDQYIRPTQNGKSTTQPNNNPFSHSIEDRQDANNLLANFTDNKTQKFPDTKDFQIFDQSASNNDVTNFNSNLDNNVINARNGTISPSMRFDGQTQSPLSSLQTASPPSQLLSEEGFAELDNFMTTF